LAEGAFGVVEAGLHGAKRRGRDVSDFGEGKILEDVEDEDGPLGLGQRGEEGEDGGVLLGAEDEVAGVGRGVVGRGGEVFVIERELAAGAAEVLRAELVGDAEEPAGEAVVFAQGVEILHGAHKGGLNEVEAGGLVTHELVDEGEKRELVAGEQGVPRAIVAGAGGGERGGQIKGGIRRGGVAGHGGVKRSCPVECASDEKVQSVEDF
jgi:hypothetical protein